MAKLKKLPGYTKSLLLSGASMTGNFVDGYYYSGEMLKINHAKQLLNFCKYIDEKIGGAGRANIDLLFQAFNNPNDKALQAEAQKVAETIKRIKSL